MSPAEYLGDGVHATLEESGIIKSHGCVDDREHIIYLEPAVYAALRRFAQAHGLEKTELTT